MASSQLVIVLIAAGIVVALLGLGLWWRHEKKRREAWQAEARRLGFSFEPVNEGFAYEHGEFKLFDAGYGQTAKNIMSGAVQGHEVVLADYQYTVGGGRSSRTFRHTICLVKSARFRLPKFNLRQEIPFYDDLGEALGGQDIDFDEDLEFSRSFVLQGSDEPAIRRLFGPDLRREFLRHRDSDLVIEGSGDQIVVHYGRRLQPEQCKSLLDLSLHLSGVLSSS